MSPAVKAALRLCFVCVAVTLLPGCASVMPGYATASPWFTLPREQADAVMRKAIMEAWRVPEEDLIPLPGDRLGYQITMYFSTERDTLSVEAFPSDGGYVFKVSHSTVAPYWGEPARERLIAILAKYAENPPK